VLLTSDHSFLSGARKTPGSQRLHCAFLGPVQVHVWRMELLVVLCTHRVMRLLLCRPGCPSVSGSSDRDIVPQSSPALNNSDCLRLLRMQTVVTLDLSVYCILWRCEDLASVRLCPAALGFRHDWAIQGELMDSLASHLRKDKPC
jgi:hypothetical protein